MPQRIQEGLTVCCEIGVLLCFGLDRLMRLVCMSVRRTTANVMTSMFFIACLTECARRQHVSRSFPMLVGFRSLSTPTPRSRSAFPLPSYLYLSSYPSIYMYRRAYIGIYNYICVCICIGTYIYTHILMHIEILVQT